MIPLTLNLITRPWYNRRLVIATLMTAVVLLLLLAAGGGVLLIKGRQELHLLKNEIRKLDAQLTERMAGLPAKDLEKQWRQVTALNAMLERHSSQQWVRRLDELEKLLPDGISLTKIEPDNKGQGLILNGRSRSFAQLQHLLEALAKSERFTEPALVTHSMAPPAEQGGQLQFVVAVRMVAP